MFSQGAMVNTNIILSWIIIALGVLGFIMSLSIADKKKNSIAVILSIVLILVGLTKYIFVKLEWSVTSKTASKITRMKNTGKTIQHVLRKKKIQQKIEQKKQKEATVTK
ncbi:MAG: hypothetical protein ABIH89_03935 [Elusimicrobiota bacterium]